MAEQPKNPWHRGAVIEPLRRAVSGWRERQALQGRDAQAIFSEYYQRNTWGSADSRSGRGSDLKQTATLREVLPKLLSELQVRRLLDVPCGDFHWMSQVPLADVEYIGGDIVPQMVEHNQAHHGREGVTFRHLDLLADELPRADLVLCRDCLVHFSLADIDRAVDRLLASQSTWLLTTVFRDRRSNTDIVTGQWRPLNLLAPPFNWPWPRLFIEEGCTEDGGRWSDKCLALWPLEALRTHRERN